MEYLQLLIKTISGARVQVPPRLAVIPLLAEDSSFLPVTSVWTGRLGRGLRQDKGDLPEGSQSVTNHDTCDDVINNKLGRALRKCQDTIFVIFCLLNLV